MIKFEQDLYDEYNKQSEGYIRKLYTNPYKKEEYLLDFCNNYRYITKFLNSYEIGDITKVSYDKIINKDKNIHYEAYKVYKIPWLINFKNNIVHVFNKKIFYKGTILEKLDIYDVNINIVSNNDNEKREIIKNINKQTINDIERFLKEEEIVKYLKTNFVYEHNDPDLDKKAIERRSIYNISFKDYNSNKLNEDWQNLSGGGNLNFTTESLKIINGQRWYVGKNKIKFEEYRNYKFEVILKGNSTGSFYCGFTGYSGSVDLGFTYINSFGNNSFGSQHYIISNNVKLNNNYTKFVGTLRGYETIYNEETKKGLNTQGNNLISGKAYKGITHISPVLIFNYHNNNYGISEISSFSLIEERNNILEYSLGVNLDNNIYRNIYTSSIYYPLRFTYFETQNYLYTIGNKYVKKINMKSYIGYYHIYVDDIVRSGKTDETGPNELLVQGKEDLDVEFLKELSNKSFENLKTYDNLTKLKVDNPYTDETLNIFDENSIVNFMNKISKGVTDDTEQFVNDLKETLFDSVSGLEENMEEFESLKDEDDECSIISESKSKKKKKIKKKIKNKKILNKLKFPNIRIPSVPNSHDILGIKPRRHGYPLGF